MSTDRPLTTGQAADYCHVTQATIVNWIKDRRLGGYTTPGGHYRIPRSKMVSFLKRHGMPIDATLKTPSPPGLLVLSNSPKIREHAQRLGDSAGYDVSMTTSDYATSAEAVRRKPDAVIIDVNTSSDPLGLCHWLSESIEETVLLLVSDGEDAATAEADEVEIHLLPDALPSLQAQLGVVLR